MNLTSPFENDQRHEETVAEMREQFEALLSVVPGRLKARAVTRGMWLMYLMGKFDESTEDIEEITQIWTRYADHHTQALACCK